MLDLAGGREAAGEGPPSIDAGDAGELLDPEARDSYRRRLEDLREALPRPNPSATACAPPAPARRSSSWAPS